MLAEMLVTRSARLLVLATDRTPVYESMEQKFDGRKNVSEDFETDWKTTGLSRLKLYFGQDVPKDKYADIVRCLVNSMIGIAHQENLVMYTAVNFPGRENLFVRSY